MLSYSPLRKSLDQLRTSLRYRQSDLARNDQELAKQFRAAAIQAFEYAFEIAIRLLRRRLEDILTAAAVDRIPFRELVRIGAEKGFIHNPQAWFRYREMRNITWHSYDESKAEMIASVLPEFAQHAAYLLAELEKDGV